MRTYLVILVVVMGLSVAARAQPYAISVVDTYNPDLPCSHCDPNDALGLPDATNVPVEGYYSLGGLGWVELELGEPVLDIAGPDFIVWEELTASWDGVPGSIGRHPDETADVLLALTPGSWTWVGRVEVGIRDSLFIDIAGTGMSGATFVRIEDVTNGGGSSPGFDVDAVVVIPEPSTVLMLACGLGVLSGVRRRLCRI